MSNKPLEREDHIVSWPRETVDERLLWLLTALATASAVYIAYVFTHPYPAYAGGLYLEIAEQISENGYAMPEQIPGYAAGGVPFAYPPLMFYVTAAIVDLTGIDPLTLLRYLPGFVVVVGLIPYFGIAEELLGDIRQAGLATLLVGVTPTTLRWHLSAGGLVRAPGFLVALSTVYMGLKLFESREWQWLVGSTVGFGLLVMTHPTYAVFAGMSVFLLFVAFDRTLDGLVDGAIVAVGGLVLASPWWAQVVSTHGFDIFATAAGTHGGLGGGLYRLAAELTYPLDDLDVEWPFFVAAYVGGLYFLYKRRWFLPAWMVASSYFIGKNRFLFVAGSMVTAGFVFQAVIPRLRRSGLDVRQARIASTATLALVVLGALSAGILYGTGAAVAIFDDSHGQPQYLDDADREAQQWIKWNTEPSAEFVALGDSAEYLPYTTDRTILVGFWGVEWKSAEGYYHQMELYDTLSECERAACLSSLLDHEGVSPDYVYVPKGEYTVRGKELEQSPMMRWSIVESDRYEIAYENDGVIVARVVDESGDSRYHSSGRLAIGGYVTGSMYGSVEPDILDRPLQWETSLEGN